LEASVVKERKRGREEGGILGGWFADDGVAMRLVEDDGDVEFVLTEWEGTMGWRSTGGS
jgi:hypothetical protein